MKRYLIPIMAAVMMLPQSVNAESVWDGSVDTEWERDLNGNYLIQSAAELAGLAYVLNSQELVYQASTEWHAYYGSGMTFLLTDDINLNNIAWEPIGCLSKDNNTNTNRVRRYFQGTFDGQGHKVKGCKVSLDGAYGGYGTSKKVTAGVWGAINNATIKNLSVENSTFYISSKTHNNYAGAIVGWMDGSSVIENSMSLNNSVTVNSPWKLGIKYGNAYAGGISGSAENSTITDCVAAANALSADGAKSESEASISNVSSNSDVSTGNSSYATVEAVAVDFNAINRKNEKAMRENIVNNAYPPHFMWSETTGLLTDVAVFSLDTVPQLIGGGSLRVYSPTAVERTIDGKSYVTVTRLDTIHVAGREYADPTLESDGYQMHYYKCYCGSEEILHSDAMGVVEFDHTIVGITGNTRVQGVFTPNYLVQIETNGVSDAFVFGASSYVAQENELIRITLLTDTIYEDMHNYSFFSAKSVLLNGSEVKDMIVPGNISTIEFVMPPSAVYIYVEFEENVYTSVRGVEADACRIQGECGAIVAQAAEPVTLQVVAMDGRVVYSDEVAGSKRIALPAGIYIANGRKVVVR